MKKTLTCLLLASASCASYADIIGFEVGAGSWAQSWEGTISNDGDSLDMQDHLGLEDENNTYFYAALEHPVPFLPNIKLSINDMSTSGKKTLSESIVFNGETYTANTTINSEIDLSHNDVVLYYEVLDNWVNLDLGIAVKIFDGHVRLEDTAGVLPTTEEDLSAPIPMLHATARFDLPLTGFFAGGTFETISYSGNGLTEYNLELGYRHATGLGISAGWREFSIELDDVDDFYSDISINGGYVNLSFDM